MYPAPGGDEGRKEIEMTIEIKGPDFDGYRVLVDGETILECLSEQEVKALTIDEIHSLLEMEV